MVYPEINENKYATNGMSAIIPPKKQKIVQFNYVPRRNPVFVETKISHPSTPLVLKVKKTKNLTGLFAYPFIIIYSFLKILWKRVIIEIS